ncbi:GNAT family N-acetyltransferase [Mesorhizobium mediterraneum]|uniref:GNAT family N-acetyltransferase n=1 Tax=Mesorhizobium mediterraneum TaxID=43617 RepID=UPI00178396AC|nr:GNAT family N-acetyltransferase [Mesorhizobium mediterraneum]
MLGDEIMGFADWLIQSQQDADTLAQAIAGITGAQWIFLEPVRINSSHGSIGDAFQRLGIPCHCRPRFQCTTMDMSRGWDHYFESRPSGFRKMLRVSERRAAAAGAVVLTEQDGGEAILDRVIGLSARSWKGQAGTGIGANDMNRAYLRALWREFSPTNDIHLNVLLLGGKEAGHSVTIDCNGVTHGLFTDFDEAFAAISPGRLMVMSSVREAAARGMASFDMLRRTHYLRRFSDDSYETSRLTVFPRRNAAWLAFLAEAGARRVAGGLTSKARRRARRIDFIHPEEGDDA